MPHNDFARALDGMEAEIAAVPNLAVLSASGPDQVSWPDEDSRRTVFGRCLLQGLRGAADDNGDGRINVWELYRYAASHVEDWTRSRRDAIQTPVLLPHGAEGERRARAMHLTLIVGRGADANAPPDTPSPVNADALRRAWDRARELSRMTPPPARYAPYAWARYRAALVRYEQLLRAGDETNAEIVLGLLPDLEEKIRQGGKLHLTSAENTLAMTALGGAGRPAGSGGGLVQHLVGRQTGGSALEVGGSCRRARTRRRTLPSGSVYARPWPSGPSTPRPATPPRWGGRPNWCAWWATRCGRPPPRAISCGWPPAICPPRGPWTRR